METLERTPKRVKTTHSGHVVTNVCTDGELTALSDVLCESDFFRAMFSNDCKEKTENTVQVIYPVVDMEIVLHWLSNLYYL